MDSRGIEEATVVPSRIGVKEAIRKAYDYLHELFEDDDLPNLRLEEVELSEDGRHWLVTYGFTASEREVESTTNPFASMLGGNTRTTRPSREYKLLTVNAGTGEVESMRIRQL